MGRLLKVGLHAAAVCVLVLFARVDPSHASHAAPKPVQVAAQDPGPGVKPERTAARLAVTDVCPEIQIGRDISTCAQRAIDLVAARANGSAGGGIVAFPARTGPYVIAGTLHVPGFVTLEGDGDQSSFLLCTAADKDCIQVGQPGGTQQRDQSILNLAIWGDHKRGGALVHVQNSFNVLLQRVDLQNAWRGIDVDTSINGVTLRDVNIRLSSGSTDSGILFHGSLDGTTRSDVLSLYNVVVDGAWAPGTALLWEGFANTLVGDSVRLLHAKYLFRVTNPGTPASAPQFANISDLEAEGATFRAMSLEAGGEFKFTGSDINNLTNSSQPQGSSDDVAVFVGNGVFGAMFVNDRIGNSQKAGLFNAGLNTQLANVQFFTTSAAGPGRYPVMQSSSSSRDFNIVGVHCEDYGGLGFASHCLKVDAGAVGVTAANVDARMVKVSPIDDPGGVGQYVNVTDNKGVTWAGFGTARVQGLRVGSAARMTQRPPAAEFFAPIARSANGAIRSAGADSADATPLGSDLNVVTDVQRGSGVRLAAWVGDERVAAKQEVFNAGHETLTVYAPTNAVIWAGGATSSSAPLKAGAHATFSCVSARTCYQGP